jgi:Flp pilus assembly protein TadD
MAGMQNGSAENDAPAQNGVQFVNIDLAMSYRKQAILLMLREMPAEAEPYLREALRLRPDDTDLLNDLGLAVWRQGRAAESEPIYRRAQQIKPGDFRILTNLGLALYKQDRLDEAGECFRRAIDSRPDTFDAIMNLGVVLSDQGKFDEAMDWLIQAHQLQPDSADALLNLGMNLARQGRWDEAIDKYEQALRLRPDFAEVHRNLAVSLLTRGDYERGWPEHEWRLKCQSHSGCRINRTFWNGDDFKGRTILLHAEQGFGDTLQFLRFVPMVKRRGGLVVLRCPTKLLRMVACCAGVDLAFDGSSYEPDCHIHAPLLSLPAIFGTTLATLPAQVPYLATDVVLVEHWRSELARAIGMEGTAGAEAAGESRHGRPARPFLIGITWQGNPGHPLDRWRSFPLAQFAPLAELPGVRLISLQTDDGLDQIAPLVGRLPIIELGGRRQRDFAETAAIMAHLDLVISADTAVAHLAGGLGKRVWVGLNAIGDWRWLVGREDSPWYPTMRLFHQTSLGDWDSVFQRMTTALEQELDVASAVA